MRSHKNLLKRPSGPLGIYYLRLYVPTSLIERLGRREIIRSLGVSRLAEAEKLADVMRASAQTFFYEARRMPSQPPDLIYTITNAYFDRVLANARAKQAYRGYTFADQELLRGQHSEMLSILDRWRRAGEYGNATPLFDKDLEENIVGLAIERGSESYQAIEVQVIDHQVALYQHLLTDLGDRSKPTLQNADADRALNVSRPVIGVPVQLIGTADVAAPVADGLSTIIAAYLDENRLVWGAKTYEKYRANLSVCAQILGPNTSLASLSKADARTLKRILTELPANWSKTLPARTPLEAATEAKGKEVKRLSPGSINAYLGSFSAFMGWADRQGHGPGNIVKGMAVRDAVADEDKRDPFSPVQLRTIFSAPLYTGMHSRHYWKRHGSIVDRSARYWLPLIALFSGMRLSETLNLRKQDVRNIDGILCFDIQKAKTRAGVRMIPVHPELVALGFMNFHAAAPDQGPMFVGCTQKALSKFYGFFLDALDIRDERLVYHSFRHNFKDAMRSARIEAPIADALFGHSDGKVGRIYGNGYPTNILDQEIRKITYPELRLDHLKQ